MSVNQEIVDLVVSNYPALGEVWRSNIMSNGYKNRIQWEIEDALLLLAKSQLLSDLSEFELRLLVVESLEKYK